jgi:hypothetical protein
LSHCCALGVKTTPSSSFTERLHEVCMGKK